MKPQELDAILKSVPVPRRAEEYWQDFPRRVLRRIARQGQAGGTAGARFWPRLGWVGFAVAVVGAVTIWSTRPHGAVAGFSGAELKGYREVWQQVTAMFPNQVRAVIFDAAGPSIVLADRPDLTLAPPLLVRACDPRGCRTVVTFSGQSVRLGTESFEVLTDSRDHIIVTGGTAVWPVASGALRISARPLEGTL